MAVSEVNQDITQESEFMPQRELEKWLRQHSAMDVFSKLRESVMGQEEALRKASILVYSFLRNVCFCQYDTKYHFMIEGTSGCGKTTFAKALKEVVPCPVIIADATQVTAAGYKGAEASDLLHSEELDAWWGCGILILDELDKLMEPISSSSSENFHRQSLDTFLKILDGGTIKARDGETNINCERILVIGMGAFSPARESQSHKEIRKIGFCDNPSESEQSPKRRAKEAKNVSKDIMASFCGSEQFMGRFLSIIHFHKPNKEVYKKIALDTVKEIRIIHGMDSFTILERDLDRLIYKAMQSEYGCRGIRAAVWESFLAGDTIITSSYIDFLKEADKCYQRLKEEASISEIIDSVNPMDDPMFREQIYA